MDIIEQINILVAAGYSLDEIRVSDGNSAWGDDCEATPNEVEELALEWILDGQDVSDLPELPTARQWYAMQLAEA